MSRRAKRPTIAPTAIDAIVVALSPALVIGMVTCLVFFLVVAFYRGEYDQRLMYILGLFTLATVLIARIAIESGRSYANAFSIPLAIVSVIAMIRFVTVSGPLGPISPLFNVILLAVAWYLADRITFDCTLVDERDGGVQQGLLQSLGLLKKDALPTHNVEPRPSVTPTGESNDKAGGSPTDAKAADNRPKKRKKKRHNPGVWVLYFSLLAFPLFGLGQLAIPDHAARSTAFYFLVGYLGCALGLLSTTSFISTRRYVRHRGASMPAEMSRSWLGYAGAGIFALLVGCMMLPLPGRSMGLVGLPFEFQSPDGLQTSRWGWGNEGKDQSQEDQSGQEPGQPSEAGVVRADAMESPPAGGALRPDGKGPAQASDQAKDDARSAPGSDGEKSDGNSSTNPNDQQTGSEPSRQQQANNSSSSQRQANQQQANQQQGNKGNQQGEASEGNKNADESDKSENSPTRTEQPGDPNNSVDREENQNDSEQSDSEEPADKDNSDNNDETGKDEVTDKADDNSPSQSNPPASQQSPPSMSSNWFNWLPTGLAEIIKWLTIAILVIIIVLYAITHPREILRLWRDILDFIARLFGGSSSRESSTVVKSASLAAPKVERRPYRSFANPFASGLQGWTPEQTIQQTFAAMEAWAAERGRERQRDETAAEFAKHVGRRVPSVDSQVAVAARMLDELMFAGWKPSPQDIAPLAAVWMALDRDSATTR